MADFSLTKYEEHSVRQSNPLTEACKAMELYEGKLYYLSLLEFNYRQDKIDGNLPLPELVIPTEVVLKIFGGNKSYYKRLKDAASSLYEISFARTDDGKIILAKENERGLIELGGEFAGERIFTSMKFSPRKGGLIFRFSENIKQEIHKLFNKDNFTLIKGKTLFSLSSMYAIRLIEMLLRFQNLPINLKRGYILLKKEIGELKYDLNIVDLKSYDSASNLKIKILAPAAADINTNTPYRFEFDDIKKGKKIIGFELRLYYPDNDYKTTNTPTEELIQDRAIRQGKEINITATVDNLNADVFDVLRYYEVGKIVARKLVKEYSDEQIRENIRYSLAQKKVKNIGAYIAKAVRENYAGQQADKAEQTQLFDVPELTIDEAVAAANIPPTIDTADVKKAVQRLIDFDFPVVDAVETTKKWCDNLNRIFSNIDYALNYGKSNKIGSYKAFIAQAIVEDYAFKERNKIAEPAAVELDTTAAQTEKDEEVKAEIERAKAAWAQDPLPAPAETEPEKFCSFLIELAQRRLKAGLSVDNNTKAILDEHNITENDLRDYTAEELFARANAAQKVSVFDEIEVLPEDEAAAEQQLSKVAELKEKMKKIIPQLTEKEINLIKKEMENEGTIKGILKDILAEKLERLGTDIYEVYYCL